MKTISPKRTSFVGLSCPQVLVLLVILLLLGNAQAALPSGSEQPLTSYALAERTVPGKEGDGAMTLHALNCRSPQRHARP